MYLFDIQIDIVNYSIYSKISDEILLHSIKDIDFVLYYVILRLFSFCYTFTPFVSSIIKII